MGNRTDAAIIVCVVIMSVTLIAALGIAILQRVREVRQAQIDAVGCLETLTQNPTSQAGTKPLGHIPTPVTEPLSAPVLNHQHRNIPR